MIRMGESYFSAAWSPLSFSSSRIFRSPFSLRQSILVIVFEKKHAHFYNGSLYNFRLRRKINIVYVSSFLLFFLIRSDFCFNFFSATINNKHRQRFVWPNDAKLTSADAPTPLAFATSFTRLDVWQSRKWRKTRQLCRWRKISAHGSSFVCPLF